MIFNAVKLPPSEFHEVKLQTMKVRKSGFFIPYCPKAKQTAMDNSTLNCPAPRLSAFAGGNTL